STSFPIFTDGIDNLNLDLHLSNSEDYKPAIYIYPEEDQQFQVKLKLNNRTQITTSIPEYTNGWDVFVEKSGKIDHKYDYLFYETSIIYLPKFSKGWCFNKSDLENEIKCLLENIGLNTKEKKEFLDFWIYKLQKYDFYKIYPIFNESINYYVELEIVPPSETTFRFRFFFEGCDNFEELPEPEIPAFERTGTTVVEWGGVMVN
nr:hypothetical protein [Candidatus Cloacimonadota bacterium]